MSQDDDYSFIRNRSPGKMIVSKSFRTEEGNARFASEVVDGAEGLEHFIERGEVLLRRTPAGRYEIKAKFLEDSRKVLTLVIQRFGWGRWPNELRSVSLRGSEIERLLDFLLGVRTVPLDGTGKRHISNEQLRDIMLSEAQARSLLEGHEDLFVSLMRSEHLKRDLVAVGYRRNELAYFDRLLTEPGFFESERSRLGTTPEALWQSFFERNTWIFGYGLSYQFMSGLDQRKLEQVIRGADVGGRGKRVDALMKTRALINSLCFVEIKRHDTPLLSQRPYRPEAWSPSEDLSGGISQVQATVQSAVEQMGRTLEPADDSGNPTGEVLFNIEPKAFLVVGTLGEFHSHHGINEPKFRSFELYRRNVRRPEIITFDELLARARFIVEDKPSPDQDDEEGESDIDDDVPF